MHRSWSREFWAHIWLSSLPRRLVGARKRSGLRVEMSFSVICHGWRGSWHFFPKFCFFFDSYWRVRSVVSLTKETVLWIAWILWNLTLISQMRLICWRNGWEFIWWQVAGSAEGTLVGLATDEPFLVNLFWLNLVPFTVVCFKTLILTVAHDLTD